MLFVMELFGVTVLTVLSMLAGIMLTLFVQWYMFNRYIMKLPPAMPADRPIVEPFQLPQSLLKSLEMEGFKPEPTVALNSILQFLFQECRNTERVRRWFRTRLTLELEELLTRTTTGKLFEAIALRDLNLGAHFPSIRNVEVKQLKLDASTGLMDDLELCLDLEYAGGFQLSIDANMRLAKTAYVSVKVNQLQGQGCLRFTRHPYTHWSFSFYNDPHLQLSVESQFQGRSLPQINSIIASQIRKAVKRKHTLPHYKLRYKPFFTKSDPGALPDENLGSPSFGVLEVTVVQVSRITDNPGPIYCSLAVDAIAWVEMVHSQSGSYLTVDTYVLKQSGLIGVQFKQEFVADKYQVCIVVDSVSPSVVGEVRSGDILVAVDGKRITTLSNVNKCVKQAGERVPLRLERRLKIVSTPPPEDKMLISQDGLRHRQGSGDKTDSDSSNSTSLSDSPARRSLRGSPEHKATPRVSVSSEIETEMPKLQVLTTKEQSYSQVISFNETLKFNIIPEYRYLNLSVWGRGEKNVLLGHISLPLATQCCVTRVGHHIDTYSLLPPDPHLVNSSTHRLASYPGFEPCLCYGDILLSTTFTATHTPACYTPPTVPSTPLSIMPAPSVSPSAAHDFERTHFNRATQCGFCFKKIWLKDAFQCRGCAMTCHKKCVSKCLTLSACGRRASVQPEIITTVVADDQQPEQPEPKPDQGRRLSTLLVSVANKGLKRVGSATNLAPPGGPDCANQGCSISLPPSPQHSPCPSRKTSLVEGCTLFSLNDEGGDEISFALEQLLSRPHDEGLMDIAKATGRQLFADLAPEARKQRIDSVLSKLKAAIDAESHEHMRLVKEEQATNDPSVKASTAFQLGKSEEKLQALTVLMLHCCAGLQDSQDCLSVPN